MPLPQGEGALFSPSHRGWVMDALCGDGGPDGLRGGAAKLRSGGGQARPSHGAQPIVRGLDAVWSKAGCRLACAFLLLSAKRHPAAIREAIDAGG